MSRDYQQFAISRNKTKTEDQLTIEKLEKRIQQSQENSKEIQEHDQSTIKRLKERIQQLHRERNTLTQETDKVQRIADTIKKALYRNEKNCCYILSDTQIQSSIILSQFMKGKRK